MSAPIVWFCVNLKSGGMVTPPPEGSLLCRPGATSYDWLECFPSVVGLSPLGRPDVIFLQEAKYFDLHGDELLLFVERQLDLHGLGSYRGFLTRSRRSAHHQVIFLNTERLRWAHHWHGADPNESRGLRGFVEVIVDGAESRKVWLKSVLLDARDGHGHGDGDGRLAEARQIHAAVPLGQRALIAGVFTPDTGAVDYLFNRGWRCQHTADGNTTPTVAPGHDRGGELIINRCLATAGLATVAGSVWVGTSTTPYSGHRAFGGAVIFDDAVVA